MWKLPNLLVILTAVVALPVVIGAIIMLGSAFLSVFRRALDVRRATQAA